jgi:hypothetical protein
MNKGLASGAPCRANLPAAYSLIPAFSYPPPPHPTEAGYQMDCSAGRAGPGGGLGLIAENFKA